MDKNPTVTLTPYTDADRDELLKLWARALPLDAITVDTLETRVLLDENFDSETFLLARSGGTLCGFVLGMRAVRLPLGDADPNGTRAWITALGVHPTDRLASVGATLLDALEAKFRALGKTECFVSTYPPGYFTPGVDRTASAALLEFLRARGYGETKQALSMDSSIVLFKVPPAVEERETALRSEGIEIRQYRRTDLLSFLRFLEATMPTDWVRVERANLKKIATGGFTEQQITVVTRGAEIIGYCQFEGSHFGPFGVSDRYQGRGIGTVLLARTLERMRTMGYHDAWVMWTDDAAAKVYGKFGFTQTRRFSILRKDLGA